AFAELTAADRWILGRLRSVITAVDEAYEDYEFAKICDALYHFAWDEVCDWYVEIAKIQLAEGGERAERTRLVLGYVFDNLLRLLHPLVPFVTEELWRALTGKPSIVVAPWPTTKGLQEDPEADAELAEFRHL